MPASFDIWIVLIVLAGVFCAFLKERYEPWLVAFYGMGALLLFGTISTHDVLAVFSNSGPLTIACMFILSASLERTGVIDYLGRTLLTHAGQRPHTSLIFMLLGVMAASAFMNNTPIVFVMAPVVLSLARKLKQPASRFLIPLSYAAILGGTCTLIGTSTNILVDSIGQTYGMPAFSLFEITGIGLILALAGSAYMALFARKLLPAHTPPFIKEEPQARLYLTKFTLPATSPYIGQTLDDIVWPDHIPLEFLDLIYSEETASPPARSFRSHPLKPGDTIFLRTTKAGFEVLKEMAHLKDGLDESAAALYAQSTMIVEGQLSAHAPLSGQALNAVPFMRTYGCSALGLSRGGKALSRDYQTVSLQSGDFILFEGPEDALTKLFEREKILSPLHLRRQALDTRKAPIALFVILSVVFLASLQVLPIAGLALLGVMALLLSHTLTPEAAYQAIDWRILMLIFGMLGLSAGMENSGAAETIVAHVTDFMQPFGPVALLFAIYLVTSALTEIMSNNAVAVLITPIVIGMAQILGYDPKAFVVAVMFAASASFATPIGYHTNTYIYRFGGYRFKDFLRIGLPLNILMLLLTVTLIPLFWPF